MEGFDPYRPSLAPGFKISLTPAARIEIALWCVGACIVLQLHLLGLPADYVRVLFLLCAVGAIGAFALASVVRPAHPVVIAVPDRIRLAWPLRGAVLGLLCAVISARLVAGDPWSAQWWWLGGVVVAVASMVIPRCQSIRRAHIRLSSATCWTVLLSVTLFAVALIVRVISIADSPPFVLGDEGQCGLYGRLFNAGHTPLLSISWFGLPMMSYAISGVGLRLFGDNLEGLRLINAVVGAAGVVLVYLLGKELFGRLAGVLAGVVLAFAFLHVEMSRDGIHYIQGPTCITLTMYLASLWLVRGGALPALLSGMTLALSVQLYWSARIAAPLLLTVLVATFVLARPLLLSRLREIVWCGAGAVIAGLPVAALFWSQPGSYAGHQNAVSVLGNDPGARAQILGEYGTLSLPVVLWHQAGRMLPTFNATPDATAMFGPWGGSMLDVLSAALLPAAVVLALLHVRHWQYSVPLLWTAAVVVGGIITLDPPNWPRTLALTPAITLLLGTLLADLWRAGSAVFRSRWFVTLALVGVLTSMVVANLGLVYGAYPAATLKTSMNATYVGRFLQHAPDAAHAVLLSDGSMYISYEAIQFLAPGVSGCTLMPRQPWETCPLIKSSRLFIVFPARQTDLPALERRRPGGKIVMVSASDVGSNAIVAYELPSQSGVRR